MLFFVIIDSIILHQNLVWKQIDNYDNSKIARLILNICHKYLF